MEEAFKNHDVSSYVYYDEKENKYTIYSDEGMEGMSSVEYVTAYLSQYNNYIGDEYLINKDIDPEEVYNNFSIETKYIEGENYLLETILSIAFTYIIIAASMAASTTATSATAVEKEQGTLETILTFPVTSKELITGKYLATSIMSLFSSLFGYIITIGSLIIAKGKYKVYDDINLFFTSENIIIGIIICIAASLLISGLAIALTANTKSYKEAQIASQILTFITLVPMFISMLNVEIISKVYYMIPILSHVQLLMDIFTVKVNYYNVIVCLASSIIISIIIIKIIVIFVRKTHFRDCIKFLGRIAPLAVYVRRNHSSEQRERLIWNIDVCFVNFVDNLNFDIHLISPIFSLIYSSHQSYYKFPRLVLNRQAKGYTNAFYSCDNRGRIECCQQLLRYLRF